MELPADQQLRKELLQFALGLQPDVEAAIQLAARMEDYVLRGYDHSGDLATGAPENVNTPSGNALACKASSQQLVECQHGHDIARKRRWTAGDDDELKRLWSTALSLEEIAQRLDRTVPSLYSRARALGYGRRDHVAASGDAGRTEQQPAVAPERGGAGLLPRPHEAADGPATTMEVVAATQPKTPCSEKLVVEQYRPERFGGKSRPARGWRATSNLRGQKLGGLSKLAGTGIEAEFGVEPIIQFLRSRDYSVVRVEEGCFRIDGRRVVNVDQLREKANKVRKSLGLPPFVQEFIGAAE